MDKDQVLEVLHETMADANYEWMRMYSSDRIRANSDEAKSAIAEVQSLYAELESLRAYKIRTESGEHVCSLAVAAEWEKSEEYISELEAMRKRVERKVQGWETNGTEDARFCASQIRKALGDSHE